MRNQKKNKTALKALTKQLGSPTWRFSYPRNRDLFLWTFSTPPYQGLVVQKIKEQLQIDLIQRKSDFSKILKVIKIGHGVDLNLLLFWKL